MTAVCDLWMNCPSNVGELFRDLAELENISNVLTHFCENSQLKGYIH